MSNILRYNPEQKAPPLWGNFIFHADNDLFAMGVLYASGLWTQALYNAAQATEKYLKALMLSIIDPEGQTLKPDSSSKRKWLNIHDLIELASYCDSRYPFYGDTATIDVLSKFTNYDQCTRYPWVPNQPKLMSATDFAELEPVLWNLRRDLPINADDYPLGIAVRKYHHRGGTVLPDSSSMIADNVIPSIYHLLPRLDEMVCWAENDPIGTC